MNIGKSIIDQIQDALGEMEDTGFLDELAEAAEAEEAPQAEETETPKDTDRQRDNL
ncbi:hypothetical protein [Celeribacter baekdonensis]|uniref:hypothetical protein n=1 Tax=Celeribacter baekdonensis TaxID=875171 RepID=UPI0026EA1F8C|nr:hypothetical protein [Celeribacter baekdonensis]|tara:strand:- start:8 stop:175 length:168 start_codon:yes stop_codon:yes gene_type:complete